MRVTTALWKDYDRRLRSLALRNRVRMTSTKKSGEASCLKEMNELLECMQANEYKDAMCATQRAAFLTCGRERIHLKETRQMMRTFLDVCFRIGEMSPNELLVYCDVAALNSGQNLNHSEGRMTSKEINEMLHTRYRDL